MSTAVSTSNLDDQEHLLDEATNNVKRHAFYMKRAMDNSQLQDVIKHASDMLYELRTGRLSPQNYYDLYISVTDELRHLESFLEEVHATAAEKSRLYEIAQHAGNIIPRLYLLITAGSVYIRSRTSPPMEILFDLVELCKGVQHPTRGLFLRSYLSQISKDKIPDINSKYISNDKDVADGVEFVLQNFAEVNKLWVRMQHQGANRDRARRERERQNLRMLVGTNLVRLSELESVTLQEYKETVLPRVLEQINACKDKIAQEYLMEVLIQVFPDDYHLATLGTFLSSCSQLQAKVCTKDIVISLMSRLSNYALNSPELIPSELEMFPLFQEHSKTIIQSKEMSLSDILSLQVALVNFASKVYPERISYVDNVLGFSTSVLQSSGSKTVPTKAVRHVVQLLTVPLETISIRVLNLSHYSDVLSYLDFENRKQVANALIQSILSSSTRLEERTKLSKLFEYVMPLIEDLEDSTATQDIVKYEFDQEQHNIARLLHLIDADDTDEHYQLYVLVFNLICKGGSSRLGYSIPALSFCILRLITRVVDREQREDSTQKIGSKKVLEFLHNCVSLVSSSHPEIAVRLFLQGAVAADRCADEDMTYELMTQAFITFEEEIAQSKSQIAAIHLFASTVASLRSLQEQGFDTLSSKTLQHSARLLKKSDQVRCICLCSRMFFASPLAKEHYHNGGKVKMCLQRALKIADSVLKAEEQASLFVEILAQLVFFYEKDVEEISAEFVSDVVELTEGHLSEIEEGKSQQRIQQLFVGVMSRIQAKNLGSNGPSNTAKLEQSSSHRPGSSAELTSSDSIPTHFSQ